MLSSQSKKIRENCSRALNCLHRGDYIKSLDHAISALRSKNSVTLRTPERIEVEGRLMEFCRDLSSAPQVIDFLATMKIRRKPFVAYKPGMEEQIAGRLDILRNRMAETPDWEEIIPCGSPAGANGTPDDAKAIREDISRARHFLKRNEFIKSIDRASAVLKGVISAGKLKKADRFEIGCYMEEYCRDLSNHPRVVKFLESIKIRRKPFVEHTPGQEARTAVKLDVLAGRMKEMKQRAEQEAERKRRLTRDKYFAEARRYIEDGEYPRARAYLRRIAEEHQDEPDVAAEAGGMLLNAGLPADAADILTPCRKRHPGHEALMQTLVLAYRANQDFEKAEKLYMEALSRFGAHPQTLLNMATMYREWHKMDKAYEFASQALELDPDLEEAREITDRMDNRLTG